MAKGYDSSLVIWETDGWFDTGTSDPYCPLLNSEGLKRTHMVNDRNSMVRNTRAMLPDSVVFEESKPEGFVEIIPRMENLAPIMMSHFQMTSQVSTGSSYIDTYVPSMKSPQFSTSDAYGSGVYGDEPGDAYSVDIWKKQADPIHAGEDTVQMFQRGICNNLDFSMQANEDFTVKADFKFKTWGTKNVTSNPGDTDYGSYTTGSITDWSHGTWAVDISNFNPTYPDGIPMGMSGIKVSCSNNLTERKILGASSRPTFNFGDYTVKGNFTTEYALEDYQSMEGTSFSIEGTIYHTDTEYMVISMPHCMVKPHEYNLKKPTEIIEFSIPFQAYENNGTAPITVTVHTDVQGLDLDFTFYDAGSTTRTLAQYDFANAGSTTRTLSEYDFADRDV